MSRPPLKALESIKRYCSKTQCRKCVFGERTTIYSNSDTDYVACYLQMHNPCDWAVDDVESGPEDSTI